VLGPVVRVQERRGLTGTGPGKMVEGLEHLSAERAGTVQPGEGSGLTLTNVYKYLVEKEEDNGARLFSVVPSNGTRGKGHKWKHRRFSLNITKHFSLRG